MRNRQPFRIICICILLNLLKFNDVMKNFILTPLIGGYRAAERPPFIMLLAVHRYWPQSCPLGNGTSTAGVSC
jgi:hypothetical protein